MRFARRVGRTFRSFVVSQPNVPCWPSERLTQFLMPARSTACSRCWLSNARLDLRARARVENLRTAVGSRFG